MRRLRLRRPRRRTVLLSTLAMLVVLALVAGLLSVQAVRRPFPSYDGALPLPGLAAPVTVHRDAYGIPQIYAETEEDLFQAQGFVHAQDRFWEMDFRRHVTSGRLAELFGPDQVETDTFLRTLGWRHVAEQEWELLSGDTRRYLTAYAAGVNAWVDETGGPAATGRKSLHYRVLGLQHPGYEVAPWDPVDTLAWLKAMAWDLRANLVHETDRAAMLAAGLSREQVDELYPDYPYHRHDPVVTTGQVIDGEFDPAVDTTGDGPGQPGQGGGEPEGAEGGPEPADGGAAAGISQAAVGELVTALRRSAERVPELLGTAGPGLGSNAWAVAGEHTRSGAPLLANDPHLGVSLPGIWYQAGLHCSCGYQAAGFTFSGVPGVIIGHNGQISWGLTNLPHDVTDLYLERIDGDRYELDGQWQALTTRQETIRVAGGEDQAIIVRQTHRGPLLSDASGQFAGIAGSEPVERELAPGTGGTNGTDLGISLAWTALTPGRTVEALFALNQAAGWDEFRAAAELFEVPAQSLTYADVDGNIGYQAPGRVPVRGAGDGRWMAPGWDSAYDWEGFLPFEELPYLLNPDSGIIVSANQPPIGPDYPHWLGADWSYGYRADRLQQLLSEATAAGPVDVPDLERMLFDNQHTFAPTLVPALLATPTAPLSRDEQAALDLLADWDFQQPAGGEPGTGQAASSAAAAYFNAVWRHLLALLFPELPEDTPPNGRDRWFEVVAGLLDEPDSPWWDRPGTDRTETRDDIVARALSDAFTELADAQGDDPAGWRWGRMHTLTLRDGAFGDSGIGPVEALFNRGPVEVSGGSDAVNATGWNAGTGYQVVTGPSMRMVVDLADLDGSRWIQATGNSGHPYHRHYVDQLEPWRTGDLLDWHWSDPAVETHTAHTLTLQP